MTTMESNRQLAIAWFRHIGVTEFHMRAHRDGTFTAYVQRDAVEPISEAIHRDGGVVVDVSRISTRRFIHYVRFDMSNAKFDLKATHGDLFVVLVTRARDLFNDLTSSEPDNEYLDQYQDDLWEIFANLPEPIGMSFKSRRDGKVLKLVFRLTLEDDTDDDEDDE